MNPPEPVANPTLTAAIAAARETPSDFTHARFRRELRNARFLTPVVITPAPQEADGAGRTTLQKNTSVGFVTMTNEADGRSYFLAFTDWEALRRWRDEADQQTLVLTLEDIRSLLGAGQPANEGFILNPATDGMLLDGAFFRLLDEAEAGGRMQYTVEKETEVLLAEPGDGLKPLADALRGHFAAGGSVRKAYLLLMKRERETSLLLVLDFEGDRVQVFDDAGYFASPRLPPGLSLDIVSVGDAFGRDATEGREPFYGKEETPVKTNGKAIQPVREITMGNTKAIETIDEYIAQFPAEIRNRLEEIRAVIRAAAPDAVEKISWQMPTYDLRGNLVHFAANKRHTGFYPGASGVEAFREKLADYQTSKGAVQLPYDHPLPRELIAEIVRYRAAENLRAAEDKARGKKAGGRLYEKGE